MSDKVKTRRMIAGAAFCAALFLFSGAMLAREYLDQKQSAEAGGKADQTGRRPYFRTGENHPAGARGCQDSGSGPEKH